MDLRKRPLKEAARITKMLDLVHGADRFDRGPLDMEELALEYTRNVAPDDAIVRIDGEDLDGCDGALVFGTGVPRRWAIMHDIGQSEGRRNFTIGHELGHWELHRHLATDEGFWCSKNDVLFRNGEGIEKEADSFAAAVLMPLNDFRNQLGARTRPDIEILGSLSRRYGVSLTATTLRWLEYTDTRAMMIVSNEGFALWAKPSKPALQSGRFIRTKNEVYELPANAMAVTGNFGAESRSGRHHPSGVWFNEPVIEMSVSSSSYEIDLTILHFETESKVELDDADSDEDLFDRVTSGFMPPR